MYIHSVTHQEKFILTIPAQIYQQYIVNLINRSSASTSGSLVKTFSKSKEISENKWMKVHVYFMSYLKLKTLKSFFLPPMRFYLAWCLGRSYTMGF